VRFLSLPGWLIGVISSQRLSAKNAVSKHRDADIDSGGTSPFSSRIASQQRLKSFEESDRLIFQKKFGSVLGRVSFLKGTTLALKN
jgi:hypothetical protein